MNPADGDLAVVMTKITALGRYRQGDEVAGMVSYLASPVHNQRVPRDLRGAIGAGCNTRVPGDRLQSIQTR